MWSFWATIGILVALVLVGTFLIGLLLVIHGKTQRKENFK